ncbi:MAG: NERD domain-containing protein [Alphaproteobacteria bacterium]|nr:NERD domain-containing protein [Alphaproteobacteria bacterium]
MRGFERTEALVYAALVLALPDEAVVAHGLKSASANGWREPDILVADDSIGIVAVEVKAIEGLAYGRIAGDSASCWNQPDGVGGRRRAVYSNGKPVDAGLQAIESVRAFVRDVVAQDGSIARRLGLAIGIVALPESPAVPVPAIEQAWAVPNLPRDRIFTAESFGSADAMLDAWERMKDTAGYSSGGTTIVAARTLRRIAEAANLEEGLDPDWRDACAQRWGQAAPAAPIEAPDEHDDHEPRAPIDGANAAALLLGTLGLDPLASAERDVPPATPSRLVRAANAAEKRRRAAAARRDQEDAARGQALKEYAVCEPALPLKFPPLDLPGAPEMQRAHLEALSRMLDDDIRSIARATLEARKPIGRMSRKRDGYNRALDAIRVEGQRRRIHLGLKSGPPEDPLVTVRIRLTAALRPLLLNNVHGTTRVIARLRDGTAPDALADEVLANPKLFGKPHRGTLTRETTTKLRQELVIALRDWLTEDSGPAAPEARRSS